jgi:pimeloyl-ACP methyl ester carboxylesterase
MLAETHSVHAIDRRGRGASGDAAEYSIEQEFEDVAAVAMALANESGRPIDVMGHSYGGRCALGAALRTDALRRVVSYEGAPAAAGVSYHPAGVEERLRHHLAANDLEGVLVTFMREVVGMSEDDLQAYRRDPIWPIRVAAASTIPRELDAEADASASIERLGRVAQPVLQILGGSSLPVFRDATLALGERLVNGRVVVIAGARHAAHHTHPAATVEAVLGFLG